MFWGSFIFEFIGALVRFLFQYVSNIFTKNRIKSFREVWNGPDKKDPINFVSYGFSNILIGFCVLMAFVWLTFKIF